MHNTEVPEQTGTSRNLIDRNYDIWLPTGGGVFLRAGRSQVEEIVREQREKQSTALFLPIGINGRIISWVGFTLEEMVHVRKQDSEKVPDKVVNFQSPDQALSKIDGLDGLKEAVNRRPWLRVVGRVAEYGVAATVAAAAVVTATITGLPLFQNQSAQAESPAKVTTNTHTLVTTCRPKLPCLDLGWLACKIPEPVEGWCPAAPANELGKSPEMVTAPFPKSAYSANGQTVISLNNFNGSDHIISGGINPILNRLVLTDTRILPYLGFAADASADGQALVVAGANGNLSSVNDTGKWVDQKTGIDDLIEVRLAPGKKNSFFSKRAALGQPVRMARLELATGNIVEMPVTGLAGPGHVVGTTPLQAIGPDTYVNRGIIRDWNGYSKITYSPNGISVQPYAGNEGYLRNRLKSFGSSTLYAFNPSTPLGGVAIHYENDVEFDRIYPTLSLYAIKGASVDPYTLTIDDVTGLRFLAAMERTYDMQNGNPIDKPNIELVGRNKLLSTAGLPSQGRIVDLFTLQQNNRRYLTAIFDRVITPGDGTGIFTADITNGPDNLVWSNADIQFLLMLRQIFLPVIGR